MPSAHVKAENVQSAMIANSVKQVTPAAEVTPQEQPEYIKQALTVIEKKVRNLDKRRIKLEEYKDLQRKGQVLNEDQLLAVSKYDEVKGTLEVAKDLDKQLIGLANDAMKQQRKQAKREQLEREEAMRERVREVQRVQLLLTTFTNETVRQDFLNSARGAQISREELNYVDEFTKLVTREVKLSKASENELIERADHFSNLIDAKTKSVASTTYAELKKLFDRIHVSAYWDAEPEQPKETEIEQTQANTSTEDFVVVSKSDAEVPAVEQELSHEVPAESTQIETPIEQQETLVVTQEQQQTLVIETQATSDGTFFTTLNPSNLAQGFLNENNEGLNFLQDSEINKPTEITSEPQYNTQQPQVQDDGFQSVEPRDQGYRQRHRENGDYQQRNGSGYRRSYDAEKRPYDAERRPYDAERRPYDGERRQYDGERRPYDGERRGGPRGGGFSNRGGPRGGGQQYSGPRPDNRGPRPEGSQGGRGGYRGKPRGGAQQYGGRFEAEAN